jgi:diaminohydroxyphosphoribosylaminopyrimidine deaminase/5-amino-6-(5-phosphoribosylamino)uracil reductase
VTALLVEGGSAVHGSFVDSNLVDEVIFFMAPVLLGGAALSVVGGRGAATLEAARRLLLESTERRGDDLELRAVVTEEGDVHRVG